MISNIKVVTFVQIVWGQVYIENYLKYTLPTELSDDNISYFRGKKAIYLFLTRSEDAAVIKKHPLYLKLCENITVDFFLLDSMFAQFTNSIFSKHSYLSAFHQVANLILIELKSAAVFLPADGLWGKGSLKRIGELIYQGYSSVFILGPRVSKEGILPAVEKFRSADGIINMSNRELANLTIANLHPQMKSFFWNTSNTNMYPSMFIWQLSDTALLSRCFYLHPIFADYGVLCKCKSDVTSTIDSDIARFVFPDNLNQYIIDDSDECMVATHSPSDEDNHIDFSQTPYNNCDSLKKKLTMNRIKYCHRYFATKRIYIHSDDFNRDDYRSSIDISDNTIWSVVNLQ